MDEKEALDIQIGAFKNRLYNLENANCHLARALSYLRNDPLANGLIEKQVRMETEIAALKAAIKQSVETWAAL